MCIPLKEGTRLHCQHQRTTAPCPYYITAAIFSNSETPNNFFFGLILLDGFLSLRVVNGYTELTQAKYWDLAAVRYKEYLPIGQGYKFEEATD